MLWIDTSINNFSPPVSFRKKCISLLLVYNNSNLWNILFMLFTSSSHFSYIKRQENLTATDPISMARIRYDYILRI